MIAISKFKYLFFVVIILFTSCSIGDPINEYAAKIWESPNGGSIKYRYRLPAKIEEGKKYPILFFLHGAGGRGADNKGQLLDANSIDAFKSQNLFSNYKTLDLLELFNLKKDYEKLGYSNDEIEIHLYQLFISPYFYGLMTVLSSVIMINIRKKTSIYFNIILGIFVSVLIYYLNFLFVSLGNTGKIPPEVSVFLPILFITIITTIGLVRINEK